MRSRIRAIAGGLVGTSALILGMAAPAGAGTARAETAGWMMDVSVVNNYTWTKTTGCESVPVNISTDGWGADAWAARMTAWHSPSGAIADQFGLDGESETGYTVDDYHWGTTVDLCPGDKPGTYVVDGTVRYGTDADYVGHPERGSVEAPFSTSFTLSKMSSVTQLSSITSDRKSAVVSGRVLAKAKAGDTSVPSGKVSIQRLVNGAWQQVDSAPVAAGGKFNKRVVGVTAAVPYRAVFTGTDKVNGSESGTAVPRLLPAPTVKVSRVSGKGKLKVDVNPNKGRGYWTFQVQKQVGGSWVTLNTTYKTSGSKEKRTINLPKGTYRVQVNPKYGYGFASSVPVALVK